MLGASVPACDPGGYPTPVWSAAVTEAQRPDDLPPVPGYAWAWLQRSRPVLTEVAQRLTGGPPSTAFWDDLRDRFVADAFTRQIVADVVVEVAFGGAVPPRRPPGASWDRGLTWWGATLVGCTPGEYSATTDHSAQTVLFEAPPARSRPGAVRPARVSSEGAPRQPNDPRPTAAPESTPAVVDRAAVVAALRALLDVADGGLVPADSLRQVIAQLNRPSDPN